MSEAFNAYLNREAASGGAGATSGLVTKSAGTSGLSGALSGAAGVAASLSPWGIAATVAGPVLGAIAGNLLGKSDRDKAQAIYDEMARQIEAIPIPDIEKQKIFLELPNIVGQLTPQLEAVEQLGPSALKDIKLDPKLKNAQMTALEDLSQQGKTPLTAQEKAELNATRRGAVREGQAAQQSILQNMAARGMGGAGQELAARLQASQAAAEQQAEQGDRTAAMAQQRALEAISRAGALGGQIRGQDWQEDSAKAQAADRISEFNLGQRADVQRRNVSSLNEAQLQNLREKQRVAEAQAATRNRQQQYNKELLQQEFENKMKKQTAVANAKMGQASNFQSNAQRTGDMWTGIGSGIGSAAAGFTMWDANKKKDEQNG